jgi:hypothetical protein
MHSSEQYINAKRALQGKRSFEIFFKNVPHSLFWFYFVELGELYIHTYTGKGKNLAGKNRLFSRTSYTLEFGLVL